MSEASKEYSSVFRISADESDIIYLLSGHGFMYCRPRGIWQINRFFTELLIMFNLIIAINEENIKMLGNLFNARAGDQLKTTRCVFKYVFILGQPALFEPIVKEFLFFICRSK